MIVDIISRYVERAAAISGWMDDKYELPWLVEQALCHNEIVEIGSYKGRSTMALSATPGRVWACDDFYGPRERGDTKPESEEGWTEVERSRIYSEFCFNLADEIASGKVVPVISDHRAMTLDVTPDMVFIDGSHEYERVKADIEYWLPRVKGLISGHDYRISTPGVMRAVDEIFGKISLCGSIWSVEL